MMREFFGGVWKGFRRFGENITLIINTVLLSLVYIIGVGITAIVARIFKKKFLDMDLHKKKTYWNELNIKKRPIKEHYRQF